MKKLKVPSIIIGFLHVMSFLCMFAAYATWYFKNNVKPGSDFNSFPNICIYTTAIWGYVCPIIYALSFVYFIVLLILSFIDSFKKKEEK